MIKRLLEKVALAAWNTSKTDHPPEKSQAANLPYLILLIQVVRLRRL